MSGVRLSVVSNEIEIGVLETATEDDFMYMRDSIFNLLENGVFGGRFPVFQSKFLTDWEANEIAALEKELVDMHVAMRALPPRPADGNWRSKLARSGRKPETLAEVFVDKDDKPLVAGMLALTRLARQNNVGIKWQ